MVGKRNEKGMNWQGGTITTPQVREAKGSRGHNKKKEEETALNIPLGKQRLGKELSCIGLVIPRRKGKARARALTWHRTME